MNFFPTLCKLYFYLGVSHYFYRTLWKIESGMENVPCEVFMNEEKIETNLMEEENPNLQTQENVLLEDEIEITKLQLEKLMN
jgi:hypothetical protein